MISLLLLVSGFASGFALQPNPALVRSAAMRHAISSPARTALRTDMLAAKDDEGCDVDAPKPPTLAGEKVAVTAIACAVAAGVWYAGLGNVFAKIGSSPILKKAAKRAIGGGLSGAIAGVVQVLTLMWMRTTMNYQYRYGSSTKEAMKKLYEEGGIARFYQGVTFAIFQTPLSRFGDTAANTGVLELLAMTTWGAGLPMATQTAMASAAGSLWRIAITPIDTLKTTMQVEGPKAMALLKTKVSCEGPTVLYQGALANAIANFVGSFPWFFTFNLFMKRLPAAPEGAILFKLLRSAVAGVAASCVSDCISNVLRVLKTTRQTSATTIGYREAIKQIVEKDGVKGLFGRGLGTRLLTNAVQASLFTVVWKYLEMNMNA